MAFHGARGRVHSFPRVPSLGMVSRGWRNCALEPNYHLILVPCVHYSGYSHSGTSLDTFWNGRMQPVGIKQLAGAHQSLLVRGWTHMELFLTPGHALCTTPIDAWGGIKTVLREGEVNLFGWWVLAVTSSWVLALLWPAWALVLASLGGKEQQMVHHSAPTTDSFPSP